MKHILSIGDVHGRDAWKFLTHGSSYEYNVWRTAVDNGASPTDNEFWKELPYSKFDKIIFIGDYVDSFVIDNLTILSELNDIIHFKRVMGDRVELLIGNHDISYIIHGQSCSGFRPEMQFDLYKIFHDDINFFKIAHEETSSDGSIWLWTHAGVSSGWYNQSFLRHISSPKYRFADIVKEFDMDNKTVSEQLNFAWELKLTSLYDVDYYSGGISPWAGPLWVRPGIFDENPLSGYNQIVGHTPVNDIIIYEPDDIDGGSHIKHVYIDCLEYGKTNGFELELE